MVLIDLVHNKCPLSVLLTTFALCHCVLTKCVCVWQGNSDLFLFLNKDTHLIVGAPLSWPHLNLIVFLRPCLQIPSYWEFKPQHMNLGGGDTNIQFIAGWIATSSDVEGFYSGPICVIVMVYWLPLILQVYFHAPRSHVEFGQLILFPCPTSASLVLSASLSPVLCWIYHCPFSGVNVYMLV